MRIKQKRFSMPFVVYEEPMPAKAFKLITFLFMVSTCSGACQPGYDAMMRAIRDHDGDKGSSATIRRWLKYLKSKGWIHSMRRTQGKMLIWVQIPHRLRRSEKPPETDISVVQL